MIEQQLITLGSHLARLRFSKQLKQAELAYEAGVSLRTLQRLEAGEIVRSDVLIKVIACLGKLDGVMAALATTEFSPFEMLADAGLRPTQLRERPTIPLNNERNRDNTGAANTSGRGKRRVRRAAKTPTRASKPGAANSPAVTVLWPEDK